MAFIVYEVGAKKLRKIEDMGASNIKQARKNVFWGIVEAPKGTSPLVFIIKDDNGNVAGTIDNKDGIVKFRKEGSADFGIGEDGRLFALKGKSGAKKRAKDAGVNVPTPTGRIPRRPLFDAMKTSNIPTPNRYDKKGKWVIARRNDLTGDIMFIDRKGELTANINNAMRYSDNKTVKGVVVRGDKGKATSVARRLNKERKNKHEKWFVTKLDTVKDENGKAVIGESGKPKLKIKGSDVSFDKSNISNMRVKYILTIRGSVVGRESNLISARESAIEWENKVEPVYISKTVPVYTTKKITEIDDNGKEITKTKTYRSAGRTEFVGAVVWDNTLNTYTWWTNRTGERPAYDVKGKRVAGQRYSIVSKYTLNDKGEVKEKIPVGKTADDIRAERRLENMRNEFAKAGINFRVEDADKKSRSPRKG